MFPGSDEGKDEKKRGAARTRRRSWGSFFVLFFSGEFEINMTKVVEVSRWELIKKRWRHTLRNSFSVIEGSISSRTLRMRMSRAHLNSKPSEKKWPALVFEFPFLSFFLSVCADVVGVVQWRCSFCFLFFYCNRLCNEGSNIFLSETSNDDGIDKREESCYYIWLYFSFNSSRHFSSFANLYFLPPSQFGFPLIFRLILKQKP